MINKYSIDGKATVIELNQERGGKMSVFSTHPGVDEMFGDVVIMFDIEDVNFCWAIVSDSPQKVDRIINALIKHRDQVWGRRKADLAFSPVPNQISAS